jgi:4-hydroxybutyryl-CoA dehydratase/vinylacetyl-CoA-Delta-isomerase
MHGAGSPQAQRIQISRKVDIEEKKNFAKKLSGIIKRENIRLLWTHRLRLEQKFVGL